MEFEAGHDSIEMDVVIVNPVAAATEINKRLSDTNKETEINVAEDNKEKDEVPAEFIIANCSQFEFEPDIIKIPDEIKSQIPLPVPIFVQFSMMVFGMTSIFAYNLFFNSTTYFKIKFTALEDISTKYSFYFNFAAMPTTVVFGFSSMFLIKLVRLETMVWGSYIMVFGLFVLTTILAKADTNGYEIYFFVATLISLMGMTMGGVLSTTSLMALSSMMSPKLVKQYFVGQGMSGIIAVLLNIMFTAIPNFDGLKAGFYCFGSGIVLLAIVLSIFYMFTMHKYVALYIEQSLNLTADNNDLSEGEKKTKVIELIPKAVKLAFVTLFTHFLLLSIHPSLMILLQQSENGSVDDKFFLLLHLFLVFAIADFSGKTFSQFIKFPGKDTILYFAVIRVVIAVLLVMCNIQPRSIPVWFKADWVPVLLIFIFGFTHGHIVSLSYSYAPSVVENGVDKAVVVTIHHCATFIGLILGTAVSFLLQELINV